MGHPKNVAEMKLGQTAVVADILDKNLLSAFLERGLAPEAPIRCNFKGPMGCPVCVHVSGCNLSLRLSEAALVAVRKTNTPKNAESEHSAGG